MSSYEMEFYNAANGVSFRMNWKNENEFRLGQEFLRELVGQPAGQPDGKTGSPESYYLPDMRALEALMDFRQKLRKRR